MKATIEQKNNLINEIVEMFNIQQLTEKDIKIIKCFILGYIDKKITGLCK